MTGVWRVHGIYFSENAWVSNTKGKMPLKRNTDVSEKNEQTQ